MLFSFVLGMIGSPWFEANVRRQLPPALQGDTGVQLRIDALAVRIARLEASPPSPASALESGTAPDPARLAALETQAAALQAIDASTTARVDQLAAALLRASGEAEVADRQVGELFLVAVARRMLESGRSLALLEPALDARFGARDQAAVEALAAWSRVPQTRATLAARLETLDLTASRTAAAEGWWARLRSKLSGLITVGTSSSPGVIDPGAQAGASAALGGGDVALAVSRLQRGPAGPARDQWIADAQSLLAAEAALDRLEFGLVQSAIARAPAIASPPVNRPALVVPPPVNALPPPVGAPPPLNSPAP